jgi:hypothetical protein
MSADIWQARVEGALKAHFKQSDGSSRPGTDYKIALKRGDQVCQIFVRAYLADDLTPIARADANYQGQTVIGYVFDRLAPGWEPTGEMFPFPPLTILNPRAANPGPTPANPGPAPTPPQKRGLVTRLFGR